jgi:ABC-type transport system involved in cytochrome bd biosynthesis fused ATPase/permease subunit
MAGRSVFNAFDAGHYALQYFHQHFARYTQAQYAAGMSRVNIETTSVGMGFFFDIVILGVELLFVGLGQITIFQYAALAILTPNYTWLFYSFPAEFASFIEGLTPAVRIQDSLAVPLPPVADSAPLQLNPVRLRTADLQFTYPDGKTPVLQNVNFSVGLAAHEKILISGESGGGKTSLLKVLLGDYQPSAGRVQLEYADGTQTQMTASEIGYVPQANELIAGDLRSNILLGRSLSAAAYQGILEQVGLNDLAATLDRNQSGSLTGLSAGQLQKVGIARALVSGRPLLIMDEPFANLDETAKGQLAVILSNLDAAVIVVSHQFDFAPFWQRHLVLTRGVLMEAGQ